MSNDPCPACGHSLRRDVHTDDGCNEGWEWGADGLSTVEGCECELALAANL